MAQQPTNATRRGRIDREIILDALLRLSQEGPRSRLTFQRLGDDLGVDATAMYRHFRNKDELMRAALDRLIERTVEASAAETVGKPWRERLELLSQSLAEAALVHPTIGQDAATLTTEGPGEAAEMEFVLAACHEAGFRGAALVRAYAAFDSTMLAQIAGMAREAALDPDIAPGSPAPWVERLNVSQPTHYPLLVAHQEELLALDGMSVYHASIESVLDSIERASTTCAGQATPPK
jgi:TetR/AcrR family tetracycline transcriptional repressor